MEQPEGRNRVPFWAAMDRRWILFLLAFTCCAAPIIANALLLKHSVPVWVYPLSGAIAAIPLMAALGVIGNIGSRRDEAEARQRVRKAEDRLYEELRRPSTALGANVGPLSEVDIEASDRERLAHNVTVGLLAEQIIIKKRDDRLTLAALWDVTHSRLDLYHKIVTGQARRSFWAAQAAMLVGFGLLIGFAVLAFRAKTTTAAISVGGLGTVGAAFAAYIGRTFIRSQESAATHLRAYFDQPLELSRYLAAERLMADSTELTSGMSADQRAAILSTLVQAIATSGHENGSSKTTRNRSRLAR